MVNSCKDCVFYGGKEKYDTKIGDFEVYKCKLVNREYDNCKSCAYFISKNVKGA